MLRPSDFSTAEAIGYFAAAFCVYGLTLAFYRVYLGPLRGFPGPKLAAATFWYEFYYDVVLGGQYTFHIIHLHEKYGPVIRINPSEIHVSTPEFYDVLYSGAGRRRHKWHWASRAFGADKSLFATVSHETHRMRRSALNPFFSMTKVRNLESVIQERVDAFLRRIAEFGNDGGILRLDAACAAYTADVIVEYAFARSGRALEAPDFDIAFHKSCIDGGRQLFLTRQFPILLTLVKKIPYAMMLKINPSMASFFNMHKDIAVQVGRVYHQAPSERPQTAHTTIFHEIMDSKLPPEQKTMRHLAEEAGSLIGAGTVTTAWALTVAVFNLLREPECLEKLKRELIEALPSGEAETGKGLLASLEKLPYLHAVIQEALRLSYGVASRLARIAPDEELVVPGNMEWRIPANTPVSMTQLQLFRDSKMFPSPLRFRPERWIENPRLDRFQFVFCKGSRICLGKNLAIAEMQLLLAGLFLTHGSKDVNMEHDIGYLELWQTDESDVECSVDAFVPQPKRDTKGVRCKIHRK